MVRSEPDNGLGCESVRVISGEEEAAYGFAAVNFALGTLIPPTSSPHKPPGGLPPAAFGTIDLGGASTQIAFVEPNQDVMANLFPLAIGEQVHWNIYAHSFLQFGHNSARLRAMRAMALARAAWLQTWTTPANVAADPSASANAANELQAIHAAMGPLGLATWNVTHPCLPVGFAESPLTVPAFALGYAEAGTNAISASLAMQPYRHRRLGGEDGGDLRSATASSGDQTVVVTFVGGRLPENEARSMGLLPNLSQMQQCSAIASQLMHKDRNSWCTFSHSGECSFLGVYQPTLPGIVPDLAMQPSPAVKSVIDRYGSFVGFAAYTTIWDLLRLNETTTIIELRQATERVCNMDWSALQSFFEESKAQASEKRRLQAVANGHFTEDNLPPRFAALLAEREEAMQAQSRSGSRKLLAFEKNEEYLPHLCFMATYAHRLITEGFGIPERMSLVDQGGSSYNTRLRVVNVLQGHKIGWPLGAMLHEINQLPWVYQPLQGLPHGAPTVSADPTIAWLLPLLAVLAAIGAAAVIAPVARLAATALRRRRHGEATAAATAATAAGAVAAQQLPERQHELRRPAWQLLPSYRGGGYQRIS